jgi:hypothetical protein
MDVASRVFRLIQLEGDWYWRLDIKNDDGLSARSCPGRRRRKTPRRRWELQRAGTDGCVCPRTKGRRCLFALRRSVGPACKRNWPRPAQVALVPPPRSRKAPLRRASLKVTWRDVVTKLRRRGETPRTSLCPPTTLVDRAAEFYAQRLPPTPDCSRTSWRRLKK